MCAICALFGATPHDSADFLTGFMATKHRGPHAFRIENLDSKNTSCMVGYHRLEVGETLNYKAMQPLRHNSLILLCNGDIYNWKTMDGYDSEVTCDVQMIMKQYEQNKNDLKLLGSKLDGVYAFCLIDLAESKILIGRDYMGVRPLFKMTGPCGFLAISSCPMGLKPLEDDPTKEIQTRSYSEVKRGTIEVYGLRDGGAYFNECITYEPEMQETQTKGSVECLRNALTKMMNIPTSRLGFVLNSDVSLKLLNIVMENWSPSRGKLQVFLTTSKLSLNLNKFMDKIHIHQVNEGALDTQENPYSYLTGVAKFASTHTEVAILIIDVQGRFDEFFFAIINRDTCKYSVEFRAPLCDYNIMKTWETSAPDLNTF